MIVFNYQFIIHYYYSICSFQKVYPQYQQPVTGQQQYQQPVGAQQPIQQPIYVNQYPQQQQYPIQQQYPAQNPQLTTTINPNINNHRLNTIPTDEDEDDDDDGTTHNPGSSNGLQSFQQHPRLYLPSHQTQTSNPISSSASSTVNYVSNSTSKSIF